MAVLQGPLYVAAARVDPFRQHAESLQPAVPGRGARDAAAVRGPRHRRHPMEPAGPRPAGCGCRSQRGALGAITALSLPLSETGHECLRSTFGLIARIVVASSEGLVFQA